MAVSSVLPSFSRGVPTVSLWATNWGAEPNLTIWSLFVDDIGAFSAQFELKNSVVLFRVKSCNIEILECLTFC